MWDHAREKEEESWASRGGRDEESWAERDVTKRDIHGKEREGEVVGCGGERYLVERERGGGGWVWQRERRGGGWL